MRECFNAIGLFQGLDMHKRQIGEHVAFESTAWQGAFEAEYTLTRLAPLILDMVCEYVYYHFFHSVPNPHTCAHIHMHARTPARAREHNHPHTHTLFLHSASPTPPRQL